MFLISIFIFVLAINLNCYAYKILVSSPTITPSHMVSTGRIADVLHGDGHNVTVLELHYAFEPGSLKAVKVANLWKRTFEWKNRPKSFLASEQTKNILHEPTFIEYINGNYVWHDLMAEGCLEALKDGTLIEEIKRQKFDVIMMEQLEWCAQSIAHLAGIKTKIWMSSCPVMEHMSSAIGLSAPYSYVPATMDNTYSDKMNIWQRARNIMLGSFVEYFFTRSSRVTRNLLNEHLNANLPNLLELAAESELIFTNIDEFLTFPRPQSSNVINVGGLGLITKQKPLESPFKELMNKSSNGVIYFALGSVLATNHLPLTFRKNLLQAFANLKDYQFIVKVSKDDKESQEIAKSMPNVYVTTWAPQSSILAHPNMKLFVSHGGYNSLLEAARFAVPMLLVPLANDGYGNSRLIERNKWGVYFEKTKLLHSHTELQSTIKEMLNNPIYKQNALRTQRLFLNKPMTAEEKLTKYVRLLEMNNGELPELRSVASKLSFIELYNLDIYFLVFLTLSLTIYLLVSVFKILLSLCFVVKSKSKTE